MYFLFISFDVVRIIIEFVLTWPIEVLTCLVLYEVVVLVGYLLVGWSIGLFWAPLIIASIMAVTASLFIGIVAACSEIEVDEDYLPNRAYPEPPPPHKRHGFFDGIDELEPQEMQELLNQFGT